MERTYHAFAALLRLLSLVAFPSTSSRSTLIKTPSFLQLSIISLLNLCSSIECWLMSTSLSVPQPFLWLTAEYWRQATSLLWDSSFAFLQYSNVACLSPCGEGEKAKNLAGYYRPQPDELPLLFRLLPCSVHPIVIWSNQVSSNCLWTKRTTAYFLTKCAPEFNRTAASDYFRCFSH